MQIMFSASKKIVVQPYRLGW